MKFSEIEKLCKEVQSIKVIKDAINSEKETKPYIGRGPNVLFVSTLLEAFPNLEEMVNLREEAIMSKFDNEEE